MLGIILTLLAVFLVICFAFHYSGHPMERGPRADSLFFLNQKPFGKKSKNPND